MNPDFVTPYGFWSPLLWLLVILVALLISYIIWRRGNPEYKKGTEQTKPFLSGNAPESRDSLMLSASNIYWGFISSLTSYYKWMKKMHSGDIRDYIGWYVGVLAIMLLIYMLWGGAP